MSESNLEQSRKSSGCSRSKYSSIDWKNVQRLYDQGKTLKRIALELNIPHGSIRYLAKKNNIRIKNNAEANKFYFSKEITREKLVDLYIDKGLPISGVCRELNVSRALVHKHLVRFEIPRKPKHKPYGRPWNYKGGITPLLVAIRHTDKYKEWRLSVFRRDGFKCVKCGNDKSGNLQGDHLKLWSIIFKEFLEKYNCFSPIDDYETLIKLSQTYEPFWVVSNGQTLCKICHKEKTKVNREHLIGQSNKHKG